MSPEKLDATRKAYDEDRRVRAFDGKLKMMQVVLADKEIPAIMKQESAYEFFTSVKSWRNEVTIRSVEMSGEYEPGTYISRISPTPILFIVANKDTVNTADLALKAYKEARQPKKLVMIEGDHFVPYVEQFDICAKAACDWFKANLFF